MIPQVTAEGSQPDSTSTVDEAAVSVPKARTRASVQAARPTRLWLIMEVQLPGGRRACVRDPRNRPFLVLPKHL